MPEEPRLYMFELERLAQERMRDRNLTTFVSSDHGFAPQFLAIDASKVLVDLGLLSTPQTSNCRPAAGETKGSAKACYAGGALQIYLNVDGIGYSVFCDELASYSADRDLSYRNDHVPGEKAYFDFAGLTLRYQDAAVVRTAQVFVAALGYSGDELARRPAPRLRRVGRRAPRGRAGLCGAPHNVESLLPTDRGAAPPRR